MATRLTVLGPGGGSGITASGVIPIPYPAAVGSTVAGSPFDVSAVWAGVGNEDRYVSEGPVAWVLLRNDSDSLLLLLWPSSSEPCFLHPGEVMTEPVPRDETSFTLQIVAQNPFKTHPLEVLTVLGYNRRDIANGHLLVQSATINPSVPAAAVGPGALPAGVTDNNPDVFAPSTLGPGALDTDVTMGAAQLTSGALPAGVTVQAGQVQPGTYPAGDFSLQGILHWLTTLSSADQVEDWQQGYGLFSDNVGVFAGSTSRLWIASDGSAQISELHVGPRTGNTLNWVRYRAANFRIDGGGATTPGSFQVQGGVKTSLDAGAITTDGSGRLTLASVAAIGGKATAGSFGVPAIVASPAPVVVTATTQQTILSYTPAATGTFRANLDILCNNSTGQVLTAFVRYTPPGLVAVNVAFATTILAGGGAAPDSPRTLDGTGLAMPSPVGIPCMPISFRAGGGSAITILYQDPGGAPNDTITAILEQLATG